MPSQNASPDEWHLFWKLLHNYYAIIARPRFGKRTLENDVISNQSPPSSPNELLSIINKFTDNHHSEQSFPYSLNHIDANGDGRIELNELYRFLYPDL
ncbi:unnamed protein product [Didymodactylos carnosus]|uniref:EF-hand domain-containing protein n=1 Tax=Didymodactylos carnosus TaxID=1234261 RepID=A0A813S5X4_9BILA|nr:unnamed protein product [Didymodactylos carnosus]CAF1375052.1 unnamed protein product [Didymodactylos carnosus]CAF3575958.1 unnamed protein product [Didymodactylos carnosus]CAF4183944.1 unnamed protein product [Didymodactylos carnosus]